jgi:putative transcriptional regulator
MKYKSDAYEAVHEDAVSMYEIGAISEERMKEYDEMCLAQKTNPAVDEAEKSIVKEHATA